MALTKVSHTRGSGYLVQVPSFQDTRFRGYDINNLIRIPLRETPYRHSTVPVHGVLYPVLECPD